MNFYLDTLYRTLNVIEDFRDVSENRTRFDKEYKEIAREIQREIKRESQPDIETSSQELNTFLAAFGVV